MALIQEDEFEEKKGREKKDCENPTTRIPVCLCLDTSESMDCVVAGDFHDTDTTIWKDGEKWNVVEGENIITRLDLMKDGIKEFYEAICNDEMARNSADVSIVTFDSSAKKITDFTPVSEVNVDKLELTTDGNTYIGEGVNLALDLLDERKKTYRKLGISYFQPWLIIMTDGYANGDKVEFQRAVDRLTDLVNTRKITIFPIAICHDADIKQLHQLSPDVPDRKVTGAKKSKPPLYLKGLRFKEFFEWLSESIEQISRSDTGMITLDIEKIATWAEIQP